MPRKLLFETDKFPYHIYNRSNNKDFFYLDNQILWHIFMDVFSVLGEEYGVVIHSFVLMNNHYHLILSTPEMNLSAAMTYMHREVAKKANKRSQRMNHFFGGRYKWSVISDESYYWNVVKYVFRNPVSAGICSKVEDYRFSSFNRGSDHDWRMVDFFQDSKVQVNLDCDWLNEVFLSDQAKSLSLGLRRREFKPPISKSGFQIKFDMPLRKKELGT